MCSLLWVDRGAGDAKENLNMAPLASKKMLIGAAIGNETYIGVLSLADSAIVLGLGAV